MSFLIYSMCSIFFVSHRVEEHPAPNPTPTNKFAMCSQIKLADPWTRKKGYFFFQLNGTVFWPIGLFNLIVTRLEQAKSFILRKCKI